MMSKRSDTKLSLTCFDNSVWYIDTGVSNHMCGTIIFLRSSPKLRSDTYHLEMHQMW